jgi:tetratricopeptide (TPR) repeat protein
MMAQNNRWLPGLDDRRGPATSISDARAGELVDAALDSAFAPVPPPPRVRRISPSLALGTVAALAAAVAVVAALRWTRHAPRASSPPPAPAAETSTLVIPPASARASEPLPLPTDAPTGGPSLAPPHAPRNSPSVTDLLAHANELRAARRWRDAAQAYERVLSLQPASPEAYAASVAAADLHLEQLHDPAGALRLYRKARGAPNAGGRLGEQVLWGVARSTRALAEPSAEAAALRDYLSQYPAGLFVTDARARLAELARSP